LRQFTWETNLDFKNNSSPINKSQQAFISFENIKNKRTQLEIKSGKPETSGKHRRKKS
jgi:hypothetical protein